MSEKKKLSVSVLLMIISIGILIIYGIRYGANDQFIIRSSGRKPVTMIQKKPSGMISINEADETELTELHGIGETLAALIVEERNQNGRFWYPEDITAVKGIGIKKLNGFLDTINLD